MANPPNSVRSITQFARQAQYLSERENPIYTPLFKATMRYVPLAMRLYRFKHYFDMERDYAGFNIESGRPIRQALAQENEAYVKRVAPSKYWNALIPKTEIGCKRKVLDTEYLKSLWRENVELISEDPVERITEEGVVTRNGREVKADAVVLAIGFATQQMLCPMEIVGRKGLKLNDYVSSYSKTTRHHEKARKKACVLIQIQWDTTTQGVAQAYFGTVVPNFPNFFILMGPNTVTGHLSVIYTVECQINFTLRLLTPIIESLPTYRSQSYTPKLLTPAPATVEVRLSAAVADSQWTQNAASKLVWASGCTNWAVDAKTGMNNMMYPDWQLLYWWRSVFWKKADFVYTDERTGEEVRPGELKKWAGRFIMAAAVVGFVVKREELLGWFRGSEFKGLMRSLRV
jgi:hypothetical protein